MKRILLLIFALYFSSFVCFAQKDARQREARYLHKIQKQEVKENYKRQKFNYKPSGYMTREEYESLSQYKNKQDINISKNVKQSDMKYVPKPTYRIGRYNDPPGSPELNITKDFYKYRLYSGTGIVSSDYKIMVYPVVYYYPNSASTASDLFVVPLEDAVTPLKKIQNANVAKRNPEPILSTEKSISDDSAFRSLTPVDFSQDSTKLLVKEKLGSSQDGIWKTNMIVYDFNTNTSYNLVELRDAIAYYWKQNHALNLDDYRWDIFPLGFLQNEQERVAAYGYAYTGKKPVYLGLWSVDIKGEQSRLISITPKDVEIAMHGLKLVQDGVEKKIIVEQEQKALKKTERMDKKEQRAQKKADFKKMKTDYKSKIKKMNEQYKEEQKDFNKRQKIGGSTSLNDNPKKFKELKVNELEKEIKKEEKSLEKIKDKLNISN